jgi:methylated-DNA-protein-cysteine methyltransferase related protein
VSSGERAAFSCSGVTAMTSESAATADDRVEPSAYVEAVLDLVERIPPGRVMSYGAIAAYLFDHFGRGSARRVGTIMAVHGGAVPWYRVVSSVGRLPPGHEAQARRSLEGEGVVFRGPHVAMANYSWWPPDP